LRNERRDAVEEEVVKFGAGLTADFEDVFESGGGDKSGAGSFAFEQRVGADGGAVQEDEVAVVIYFLKSLDDGLGGVGGSGEDF
jgi:hypothetical protein